jgi:hypothetical protein
MEYGIVRMRRGEDESYVVDTWGQPGLGRICQG